jgi:ferredoxin
MEPRAPALRVGESLPERVPENAPGRYCVNRDCVDCDTCRALAPAHFQRVAGGGYSYVVRQPASAEEIARVEEALDCCPADAIVREAE